MDFDKYIYHITTTTIKIEHFQQPKMLYPFQVDLHSTLPLPLAALPCTPSSHPLLPQATTGLLSITVN